jgi:hypothetical protein
MTDYLPMLVDTVACKAQWWANLAHVRGCIQHHHRGDLWYLNDPVLNQNDHESKRWFLNM